MYNVVARPDLGTVGIETVWAWCKKIYRAEIERVQCLNRPYDHSGLV